jgi:MFS family permease
MTFFIFMTAFISGFVMMGFEIFGTRVLAPYFGGGMHVWGALISVVLSGLSLGYAAGGFLADKSNPHRVLIQSMLGAGLLLLLFPFTGPFICRLIDAFSLDRKSSTLIAALLLFLIPAFFIGCITPLLVKLKVHSVDSVGKESGVIYSVATGGSIAGTLATAFYLIASPLGTLNTIALFGGVLVLNAVLLVSIKKCRE